MAIPLVLLAVGAVASGWVGVPPFIGEMFGVENSNLFGAFIGHVVSQPAAHGAPGQEMMVTAMSVVVGLLGISLAGVFYISKPGIPKALAKNFSGVHKLLWNKYYIDELYNFIIIKPTLWVAKSVLVDTTDGKIIEGVVNGVPRGIGSFGQRLRKLQTGVLQNYAAMMALGVFVFVAIALMILVGGVKG